MPNPNEVAGSLLIGFLLNTGFFGILSVQIYHYFVSFPRDKVYLKLLVAGVYLIEVAQTIVTVCDAYAVFAIGFGDVTNLAAIRTSWIYSPLLGGIVGFLVQGFYAHRINTLYNSRKLGFIIIILSVSQLVASQMFAVFTKMRNVEEISGRGWSASIAWLAFSFACDMTIVISMTSWFIRAQCRGTGHVATRGIVIALRCNTVGNGTALALMTTTTIVVYTVAPKHLLYPTIVTFPKWYSITLLKSLNNRSDIQRQGDSTVVPTGIKFQAATTINMNTLQLPDPPVSVAIDRRSAV